MDHFTAYLFVLVILLVREGKLIEVDSAFGKVRHNSRIESRLGCMYGALRKVPKSSILFAGNGAVKLSSVACGFSSIKFDYSDYPKSLISRLNEVYVFSIKYR